MRYRIDLSGDPVVLFATILLMIPACYLVWRTWRHYLHRYRHRRWQHRHRS